MNTHDRHHSAAIGPRGLHPRLSVLLAGNDERASLTEQLARLLSGAPDQLELLGPDDLDATARDMAVHRVEAHAAVRDELTARLRSTREQQAVAANRRDEAAARHRRLAAHLTESGALLEQADQLNKTADAAESLRDERRTELEGARERLALVQEQRSAATRAIEDARSQLHDLESAELDETTLRRELEKAGHELREAEATHAESTAALAAIEAGTTERHTLREQIGQERAELVARVEAPVYDPAPIHEALAAYDSEIQPGQPDVVAQDLAREWTEVDEELARIESALPAPPSDDDLSTAQHNLAELENIIAELEATTNTARLHPEAREEIESAHETVLAAEEILDQSGGHPDAAAQLQAVRAHEQQVLAAYGYETYLDLVMSEPEPDEAQGEMLEALRARRQAEDTLTSLYAAAEPPQIVLALRQRRERIFREAADLLCCDPGENVAELLYNHPVVPPNRTTDLANSLASYGIYPVGMSARDAAIEFLHGIEREFEARDGAWGEIERLDAEIVGLDDEDSSDNDGAEQLVESARYTAADLEATSLRVETLERELSDRTSRDDRRLQRVAAAEQLRAQIAAVTEALERSDEDYHSGVADAEAAATAAEASLERATAALTDAIRKLRRIAEALPPALRPKPSSDPLGELPLLRDTLAGEVERAEVALSTANRDLERARAEIDDTQAELDAHLTVVPSDEVEPDDLRQAVGEMLGASDRPAVLDDPFTDYDDDQRTELLDLLATCAARRPVILLTDHLETLGWAISLPDDVGAVTGLPGEDDEPVPVPARSSTLSDPSGVIAPST